MTQPMVVVTITADPVVFQVHPKWAIEETQAVVVNFHKTMTIDSYTFHQYIQTC